MNRNIDRHSFITKIYQPVNKYLTKLIILVLLFLAISLSCAKRLPPPGGPVDTIPPTISYSLPAHGSVNVDIDMHLEIGFSELMDDNSVTRSIFITPDIGKVHWKWSGKKLRGTPTEGLKPKQTHILTITTDARDYHRVNLAIPYVLAFSTNTHLDSGTVSGVVYQNDSLAVNVYVYLYINSKDTLHPSTDFGDYFTQTDSLGQFNFCYLPTDSVYYRLYAFIDTNRDRRYQQGSEYFAKYEQNILLTTENDKIEDLKLSLKKEEVTN